MFIGRLGDYLGNYHIYNNAATIAFDVKASDIRIIEFSFEGIESENAGEFGDRCREVLRGVVEREGLGARQGTLFCRYE